MYIARSILGIAVLAPASAGSFGTAATAVYAIFAAAAALAATGLLHMLLLGAPRPMVFFTWITGLATVVAVVEPFGQSAPLSSKVFTAIINLIAGVADHLAAVRRGPQLGTPATGWARRARGALGADGTGAYPGTVSRERTSGKKASSS